VTRLHPDWAVAQFPEHENRTSRTNMNVYRASRVAVVCLFVWGFGREWEGLLFGEV
jgi:hypothetical protein